jgi:hypothetical protein
VAGSIEWNGDFLVAVAIVVLLAAGIALGFAVPRWRVALYLWVACVAVVLIQQALWTDDPARSGIDDLAPATLLPLTPLVMLLPALGIAVRRATALPKSRR